MSRSAAQQEDLHSTLVNYSSQQASRLVTTLISSLEVCKPSCRQIFSVVFIFGHESHLLDTPVYSEIHAGVTNQTDFASNGMVGSHAREHGDGVLHVCGSKSLNT